ncbi:heavy-metal-associated domain-containing protein [Pseudonocardia nigra]|uniref:heavy-metal-associated domain-containing protein n=1 Tax=Pseudonocardia nigra TaxID=1921578 RepID=UPI001C5D321F|nr:heavy metal-associated domain-containing protein [Pseudonocardia nigra]
MTETVALQVEGMTCTGCEQRIGTALRRVDGVRDVVADHTSGRVQVRLELATTGPGAVVDRVTQAGYTVRSDGGPEEMKQR